MVHDVTLTCPDGSVKKFRIYSLATPRVGEVVTLPIDRKPTKVRIAKAGDTEFVGSIDHVDAEEMEAA